MTVIEVPLWTSFVDVLPVDGGSISVIGAGGIGSTVSTSDEVAGQLDGLQAQLGEGPRWQAFRSGSPVLVPDVREPGALAAWPLFGLALSDTAVRAVYSFPIELGVLIVGVADLYSSSTTRSWPAALIAEAAALAAAVALPAVRLATRSAEADASAVAPSSAELRREVHQATGMLVVHLGVPAPEARARLEAYAFLAGRPVMDVARDVVAQRIDFWSRSD